MRAKRIELRAVRGFKDPFALDLSPKLTVIYGVNGSGKSSLCEAWDWVYTNQDMSDSLEPKNETKKGFQNLHTGSKAWCKVVLNEEDAEYRIERQAPSKDIQHDLPHSPPQTSPVVLQYRLQRAVYTADVDRTYFFASVLGAEDAHALVKALKGAVQSIEAEIKSARRGWDSVVEDAAHLGLTIQKANPASNDDLTIAEANLIATLAARYNCQATEADCISSVKTGGAQPKMEPIDVMGLVPPGLRAPGTIGHLEKGLVALDQLSKLDQANLEHTEWLARGLEIANPPKCPLCEEQTLDADATARIAARIEAEKKSATEWKAATVAIDEAHKVLKHGAEHVVAGILRNLASLRGAAKELPEQNQQRVLSEVEEAERAATAWKDVLAAKPDTDAASRFIGATVFLAAMAKFHSAAPGLKTALDDRLAPFHEAKFAVSALKYLESKERRTWKTALADKILAERLFTVGQREYQALLTLKIKGAEDEIRKWYGFLRPQETSKLQAIQVEHAPSMKVRFEADTHGAVGPASALFSQSNVNALGMSCYIARIRNAGHQTIVLDDPTQALDPANKKQFETEFVRRLLLEGFQVVICTHDIATARNLLDEHFEQDPVGYAFASHNKSGPVQTPLHGDVDHLIRKALDAIESKDEQRIEQASLAVRKLVEKAVGEYLAYHKVPFKPSIPLGQLIQTLDGLSYPAAPNAATMKRLNEIREGISKPLHVATQGESLTLKEAGTFLKDIVRFRISPGHLNFQDGAKWPTESGKGLKDRIAAADS